MKTPISSSQKQELIAAALSVRAHSYSPYSKFAVGSALLLANGNIVTGVNVENLSYGLGVCAERNAVCTAAGQGNRDFVAVCVSSASSPPAAPCGACRQVLAEFAPDLPIFLVNVQGEHIETNLQAIFPSQFSKEQLDCGAKNNAK